MEHNEITALNSHNRIVAIESTSHCNIKCKHCPNGVVKVADGFLSEETLIKCLKYCEGYTELNWRGEPLLHPEIARLVYVAKQTKPSLDLGLHTNALLMTESIFHDLVSNGINWLHVSLHTLESCRKYKEMVQWNEESGKPINLYADTDNSHEKLQALSMGLNTGDFRQDQIANWGGWLTGFRTANDSPEEHAKKCAFITDNMFVVAWNGMVNACCWDFEMRHCLGHIDDLDHILHKPSYELCHSCLWLR